MIANSRVIIEKDSKLLLIHRFNNGREYYVIPGGHVEQGESAIEAAKREVKEETNLEISITAFLWTLVDNFEEEKVIYVFRAGYVSGELMLNGPEKEHQNDNNRFILEWIPFPELNGLNIVPECIRRKISERYSL